MDLFIDARSHSRAEVHTFSGLRLTQREEREGGSSRKGVCPYSVHELHTCGVCMKYMFVRNFSKERLHELCADLKGGGWVNCTAKAMSL